MQEAYRAWRADKMAAMVEETRQDSRHMFSVSKDSIPEHPWRVARRGIGAFREKIACSLRFGWGPEPSPDQMRLIRRALGIPASLPMKRGWWILLDLVLFAWLHATRPDVALRALQEARYRQWAGTRATGTGLSSAAP